VCRDVETEETFLTREGHGVGEGCHRWETPSNPALTLLVVHWVVVDAQCTAVEDEGGSYVLR